MSTLVLDNIGQLVTNVPERADGGSADDRLVGVVRNASVVVEDGVVVAVGPAGQVADRRIDIGGRCLLPGFVDSHTHLVFAGDRSEEFAARMAGVPYSAGGIRVTVEATRAAPDDVLQMLAAARLAESRRAGVTTVEIKSGYGLTAAEEARSLRLARELTTETTFLGAHVVPPEHAGRADDYVALVCGEMLAAAAPHARFCDVFCETGAFDADQSRAVLLAGRGAGLIPKIHANQLGFGPGVTVAVETGCASADHCTHLTDADVALLAGSDTVATLLPISDFSTRQPYPDARRLLDAGCRVALATNCNPGSSNSTSMALCIALAVREMHMTPAEAVRAATLGGAMALRRDDVGVIAPGARADLIELDAPGYVHIAYRPGVPLVRSVWLGGEAVQLG